MCKMFNSVEHKCFFLAFALRDLVPIDNLLPKAEELPWHYVFAVLFLKMNKQYKTKEILFKHRQMYSMLMCKREVKPENVFVDVNWKRIQYKDLDNNLKDLNWKCALNRLPVRETLYRHNCSRTPKCPRGCGKDETIRHLLWECKFAGELWACTDKWIRMVAPNYNLNYDMVIYGCELIDFPKEVFKIAWLLVSWTKLILWDTRNICVKKIKYISDVKEAEFLLLGKNKETKLKLIYR